MTLATTNWRKNEDTREASAYLIVNIVKILS